MMHFKAPVFKYEITTFFFCLLALHVKAHTNSASQHTNVVYWTGYEYYLSLAC